MELEPTGEYADKPIKPERGKRPRGRQSVYDWETWTNGKPHLITQGEAEDGGDFQVRLTAMRSALHMHAQRTHQEVIVQQEGATDQILFQFYPTGTPAPVLPNIRKVRQEQQATEFCTYEECGKSLTDPQSISKGFCVHLPTRDDYDRLGDSAGLINDHTGEDAGW